MLATKLVVVAVVALAFAGPAGAVFKLPPPPPPIGVIPPQPFCLPTVCIVP